MSSKKEDVTCIQVNKKTRDKLAERGTKKDTFDDVINKLMDPKGATAPPAANDAVEESEE